MTNPIQTLRAILEDELRTRDECGGGPATMTVTDKEGAKTLFALALGQGEQATVIRGILQPQAGNIRHVDYVTEVWMRPMAEMIADGRRPAEARTHEAVMAVSVWANGACQGAVVPVASSEGQGMVADWEGFRLWNAFDGPVRDALTCWTEAAR
jgi:hypothetical protein